MKQPSVKWCFVQVFLILWVTRFTRATDFLDTSPQPLESTPLNVFGNSMTSDLRVFSKVLQLPHSDVPVYLDIVQELKVSLVFYEIAAQSPHIVVNLQSSGRHLTDTEKPTLQTESLTSDTSSTFKLHIRLNSSSGRFQWEVLPAVCAVFVILLVVFACWYFKTLHGTYRYRVKEPKESSIETDPQDNNTVEGTGGISPGGRHKITGKKEDWVSAAWRESSGKTANVSPRRHAVRELHSDWMTDTMKQPMGEQEEFAHSQPPDKACHMVPQSSVAIATKHDHRLPAAHETVVMVTLHGEKQTPPGLAVPLSRKTDLEALWDGFPFIVGVLYALQ